MGMTVPFLKFLYPAIARTGLLTDPGLPTSLPQCGPGQVRVAGLYGAGLPVQVFSNIYLELIRFNKSKFF
jgi:hypothetical protein